jgi:hypothetical protein
MVRILVLLFILILFSCERVITIDPVNVEQELVVNALIDPKGMDSLLLSSTYVTKNEWVSGANVVVIHNGDSIGRYVEKNKGIYYYEGAKFQEKMDYGLSIQHPDYISVSAITSVPLTPEYGFGTYSDNGQKVKQFSSVEILASWADIQVMLEFEDEELTSDYYMINISETYAAHYTEFIGFDTVSWESIYEEKVVFNSLDSRINSKSSIVEMTYSGSSYKFAQLNYDWETYYLASESGFIFSDKLTNGQKITIPIDINLFSPHKTTQVHLTLTAISEEYYQLLRSIATLEKNGEGFFPEALQLYGNVNNGHGIWAAKSSRTISLDISELDLFNY